MYNFRILCIVWWGMCFHYRQCKGLGESCAGLRTCVGHRNRQDSHTWAGITDSLLTAVCSVKQDWTYYQWMWYNMTLVLHRQKKRWLFTPIYTHLWQFIKLKAVRGFGGRLLIFILLLFSTVNGNKCLLRLFMITLIQWFFFFFSLISALSHVITSYGQMQRKAFKE